VKQLLHQCNLMFVIIQLAKMDIVLMILEINNVLKLHHAHH